ncbi:MAG: MFS transporter [Coriobacteriia bacterium]|nr:MFS transporter [Coriobacteriia bacterium]
MTRGSDESGMVESYEGDPAPHGGATTLPASPPPKVGGGGYRAVLGNPRFRRLWVSQFVSGIGDWLVIGFLMPLVTTLSGGSAFAVAGILIAKIIPALVFGSVIGVFVDRFDRRRLMIACDLVRAVLTFGLLVTNSLAVIYLVVLLMEMASMFFYPAKNALIPVLVDPEDLAAGNGLSYTTQQASMLIGLTASGAILALFERVVRALLAAEVPLLTEGLGLFAPELLGPRAGVFLNSLTFVVSAVAIYSISVRASAVPDGAPLLDLSLVGKDVREAFTLIGEHRELRSFLVTMGLGIFGGGAVVPLVPTYVSAHLTGEVPILGQAFASQEVGTANMVFMLVFMAFGMVAGAMTVPRLARHASLQLLFLGGVAGFGASMLVFASVGVYAVAALFAAIAGFGVAAVTVAGNTYVAEETADAVRGRVFTALESVVRVALLLSMIVMPVVADVVSSLSDRFFDARGLPLSGARIALQAASLIVIGAAVYAYRTLDWKGRRTPADA